NAGQTRAVSWFAPILLDAHRHARYREAQRAAARTAPATMGIFVQHPDAIAPARAPQHAGDGRIPLVAAPGSRGKLPWGWDVKTWDPSHPTTAFQAFDEAVLRTVATGLSVSYNTLASDLEGVNYSSLRGGKLDERDVWQLLQSWMIRHFCRRV